MQSPALAVKSPALACNSPAVRIQVTLILHHIGRLSEWTPSFLDEAVTSACGPVTHSCAQCRHGNAKHFVVDSLVQIGNITSDFHAQTGLAWDTIFNAQVTRSVANARMPCNMQQTSCNTEHRKAACEVPRNTRAAQVGQL
jgi:hypothetical protein